jgi:hypothetical protein
VMRVCGGEMKRSLLELVFFFVYWNLSSEIHACYAGALPLEPLHQPERSLLNSLVEGERDS